jgi:hypothetical protein
MPPFKKLRRSIPFNPCASVAIASISFGIEGSYSLVILPFHLDLCLLRFGILNGKATRLKDEPRGMHPKSRLIGALHKMREIPLHDESTSEASQSTYNPTTHL